MTKITVLGSGTAVSSFYKPFDFRAPPGYLLEHDGKQYLIECSDGMRGRLEKIKIQSIKERKYSSINHHLLKTRQKR